MSSADAPPGIAAPVEAPRTVGTAHRVGIAGAEETGGAAAPTAAATARARVPQARVVAAVSSATTSAPSARAPG
ncbi:hypothetical protein PJI74_30825, partial [Mycobacterium kansasii]